MDKGIAPCGQISSLEEYLTSNFELYRKNCKFQALYTTETVFSDESMPHISEDNMHALINELTSLEDSDMKRSALSFISDYSFRDIFTVDLAPDSLRNWEISGPGKRQLLRQLRNLRVRMFFFP